MSDSPTRWRERAPVPAQVTSLSWTFIAVAIIRFLVTVNKDGGHLFVLVYCQLLGTVRTLR